MLRSLPLAVLPLVALAGCVTLRTGVGPTMTGRGQGGGEANIGFGAGGGLGEDRAWFVSERIGFALAPVEKDFGLVLQAQADYVSEEGAAHRDMGFAWRAGLRAGSRLVFVDKEDGEPVSYATIGAAVAMFPWSWAGSRGGGYENDKIGPLFPSLDQRGFTNLGFELSGERNFGLDGVADQWLISLALVFEVSFLPD
jgi:hypothetical protein